MRRLLSAAREWLQLRARLRDEQRFHLDCSAADLRATGLTAREARRAARRRFGRASQKAAALELGSDLSGLAHLIRMHRAIASPWLQPAALLAATLLIFLLSPQPREIFNGVVIRVHRVEVLGSTLLTGDGRSDWFAASITDPEFDALRSMNTLTDVERYHGAFVLGRAVPGATLAAIVSEARRKSGNAALAARFVPPNWELLANPAQSAWLVMAFYGVFLLSRSARHWRWLLYGAGMGILHAAASLAVWALLVQTVPVSRSVFVILFIAWLGAAAFQCRYWWIDLNGRCPLCFERLVLPLTEGTEGSMILAPPVTESVCTHGHGVLVESRWFRAFRAEQSPIESLANF